MASVNITNKRRVDRDTLMEYFKCFNELNEAYPENSIPPNKMKRYAWGYAKLWMYENRK